MSVRILGIGTAAPSRRIAQADAATLAVGFANAQPGRERALEAIYRQTRIRTRGSVLLDDPGDAPFAQHFFPPAMHGDEAGPTTAERMERYVREAGPLAIAAARRAIADAGLAADRITHLVTCSCTGFANPGVDLDILRGLPLPPHVSRTHVGFMGCHGGLSTLAVADAFAATDPHAIVLMVCVELCSLHFQYGTRSDHVVANSIFADGAGAIVGAAADATSPPAGWRLVGRGSQVLPDSADQMSWTIGNHGFEMCLSPRVPDEIGGHLPQLVEATLRRLGLTRGDIRAWAVHPGGPRVLASVAEALALPAEALAHSRAVLADHGNMSSATILFILERMIRAGEAGPCLALAFGPGLTAELAVFSAAGA